MGMGGKRNAPAALPAVKTRYPSYRRLGGLMGRSGRVRKISPPPGFNPRTVQPVAFCYTDWVLSAHKIYTGGQSNMHVVVLKALDIYSSHYIYLKKPYKKWKPGPRKCANSSGKQRHSETGLHDSTNTTSVKRGYTELKRQIHRRRNSLCKNLSYPAAR
jgi:hypothetical protein